MIRFITRHAGSADRPEQGARSTLCRAHCRGWLAALQRNRLVPGIEACRHGVTRDSLLPVARRFPQTARLFDGGLLLREDGRVRLSERGLELADSVFAEFL